MLVIAVTPVVVACFANTHVRAVATTVATARLAANRAGLDAVTTNAVSNDLNPDLCVMKIAFGRAIALTDRLFLPLVAPAQCLAAFPAPSFRATGAASACCHVGHRCPSVCGENCPESHCVECCSGAVRGQVVDFIENKTFGELDLDINPVIVLTCGHFFTVDSVDGVMGIDLFYVRDERGEFIGLRYLKWIQFSELEELSCVCPNCHTPISQAKRYGRVNNTFTVRYAARKHTSRSAPKDPTSESTPFISPFRRAASASATSCKHSFTSAGSIAISSPRPPFGAALSLFASPRNDRQVHFRSSGSFFLLFLRVDCATSFPC
jgi:hypothetical protein